MAEENLNTNPAAEEEEVQDVNEYKRIRMDKLEELKAAMMLY